MGRGPGVLYPRKQLIRDYLKERARRAEVQVALRRKEVHWERPTWRLHRRPCRQRAMACWRATPGQTTMPGAAASTTADGMRALGPGMAKLPGRIGAAAGRQLGARTGGPPGTMQRDLNVAGLQDVTGVHHGKWVGTGCWSNRGSEAASDSRPVDKDRPSEKLLVPEFDGEGNSERELGLDARSYLRRVQVWLRCTRLPAHQQGLALYMALKGRAWACAEELDMDILGSELGAEYFMQWIRARFMEMEVSKISEMMGPLPPVPAEAGTVSARL